MKLFHNGNFLVIRLIMAQLFNPKYNKHPGCLVNFKGPWHRPLLYSNIPMIGFIIIGVAVAYHYSIWWGAFIPLVPTLFAAMELGHQILVREMSDEDLVTFMYEAYPGLIGNQD